MFGVSMFCVPNEKTCVEIEIWREKKYNIDGLTTHFGRLGWQTIINVFRCVKKIKGAQKSGRQWSVRTNENVRNMMRYEEQGTWQRHIHIIIPVQRKATPSTQIFYWLFNEHLMVLLTFNMFHFVWWDGCVYVHCKRASVRVLSSHFFGSLSRHISPKKRENNMKLMRGRWLNEGWNFSIKIYTHSACVWCTLHHTVHLFSYSFVENNIIFRRKASCNKCNNEISHVPKNERKLKMAVNRGKIQQSVAVHRGGGKMNGEAIKLEVCISVHMNFLFYVVGWKCTLHY